jgi:hypothetical protein
MSFLQPALLAAFPLVALPIIIHLINQRRYQTVRWAAMMFLLAANRMSRGYARIRQWLIMAFRMLAIAGLIFAVSRPLAGGWLGLAGGGRPDTTLILLDRSPSMQQSGAGVGDSKLETARGQLIRTLETLGSARWALIESGTNQPRELETASAMLRSSSTEPVSAPSDIPAMLQAARDFVRANKSGRTEIWIASDLRENDWNADSGRWSTLREAFLEFTQGVRFHLLAYPQTATGNLSVRVTEVRRQKSGDAAELLVSLRIVREGAGDTKESVPVQFEIDGARSEVTVEMAGPQYDLKDHRIPLERGRERGWGRVTIPADANLADNDYWFVFDQPVPRRAVIVAEDPQSVRPLELAAAISPDPAVKCSVEVIGIDQVSTVEWESLALLVWQAPLPEGDAAKTIRTFAERGGQVLFLPPTAPTNADAFGVRWGAWSDAAREITVETWRGDQDLLAHTQSGAALPVGEIQVRRYCGLTGDFTPLASLAGGQPLLARVTAGTGGVYFCTTTAGVADSTFATNGIVLYVLMQRALAAGAQVLGNTRMLSAGDPPPDNPANWKRIAGDEEATSADYALHRGVYASGERLIAINRPAAEDAAPVLADTRLNGLFRGLDFARVDDQAGSSSSLVQEVWRLFLVAMTIAMVVEAGLCLPTLARAARATS